MKGNPSHQQRGFTLFELVIANALSMVVAMVILALWYYLEREVESMLTYVRINQEMRLVVDLLQEGGKLPASTTWVGGFHYIQPANLSPMATTTLSTSSSSTVTLGSNTLRVWNNRLTLIAGGSDPNSQPFLASQQTSAIIPCQGVAIPHPDCVDSESLTVNGMISAVEVDPITRSTAGRTVEVKVTLADPLFRQEKNLQPDRFAETFFTIVAMD